jgi:rhomboid protease GluP
MQLGPKAIEVRTASAGLGLPSAHATSIIILTINLALYLATTVASMRQGAGIVWSIPIQVLVDFGAKYTPYILSGGEWWRLITAGFLHGGILHILMNSWVLFDLIAEVEAFYGTSRLLVVYLFSTITGYLASMIFLPYSPSIGASAACFGLIGVMLAIGLRRNNPMAQMIRAYYRRWAIYALVFSFLPGIDLAAHLGGLAGGFLFGLVAGLPGHPQSARERFWQIAAAVAVGITAFSFFLDFRHMLRV